MTGPTPDGDDGIGNVLATRAAQWPRRELFTLGQRRVTYGEFDDRVRAVASALVRAGVLPGDKVMVNLPNCLEALVLQAAALRIGAVDMPVIPIYRQHEVRQILDESRPTVIAASRALGSRRPTEEIDELLRELGHQPRVKYTDAEAPGRWLPVPDSDEPPTANLPEPAAADDPALLLYTSGTTTAPKGVLLSSRALLAHLNSYQGALGADDRTVLLVGTPLSHLGGFVAGVALPAFLGARSVILPSWRPDDAVEIIERERATLMMGATVFLSDLVERYEHGAGAAHRLDRYICAGASIPPDVVSRAEQVGVRAVRAYGMTETAGVCAIGESDAPDDRRFEWDGRALPGMEIQAVDESRTQLPAGQVGELRVRGPQLLNGYTDPAMTDAQLDEEGWFYPGDVGRVDPSGWVQLVGRSKDIINRGGEKLSTMDIEAALASHPDVDAVAVTAVSDNRFGEAVGAWLALAPTAEWDGPARLLDHLEASKLAKQKHPVEWHVVREIPTTATGKVQKHRLPDLRDIHTSRGRP